MFENIIGQKRVISELVREVTAKTVPRSILFHGPAYSGKLSTALELARILTCANKSAEWSCTCKSCEMQRHLTHPYTLMLGPRYFLEEIRACAEVLRRNDKPFARYLFLRAVRKLINRLDPRMWKGAEQKIAGARAPMEKITDSLEILSPDIELPDPKKLGKMLESVIGECSKIAKLVPNNNIPIDQIRRAAFWAHISSAGSLKVIVFENADRMQEGSRNAMLKILEEPPEGCHFILLTTRREGISPTIRSRLRPYQFIERLESDSNAVLGKIFREDSGEYANVREYFLAWETSSDLLRAASLHFMNAVADNDASIFADSSDSESLLKLVYDKRTLIPFLEELTKAVRHNLLELKYIGSKIGIDEIGHLEQWSRSIRECASRAEQLNISPSLLLEDLFYSMRGQA